jgi:hypothetical protein
VQVVGLRVSFLSSAERTAAQVPILSDFDARQVESTVQIFTKNSKKIRIEERDWLAVAACECDGGIYRETAKRKKPNLRSMDGSERFGFLFEDDL